MPIFEWAPGLIIDVIDEDDAPPIDDHDDGIVDIAPAAIEDDFNIISDEDGPTASHDSDEDDSIQSDHLPPIAPIDDIPPDHDAAGISDGNSIDSSDFDFNIDDAYINADDSVDDAAPPSSDQGADQLAINASPTTAPTAPTPTTDNDDDVSDDGTYAPDDNASIEPTVTNTHTHSTTTR